MYLYVCNSDNAMNETSYFYATLVWLIYALMVTNVIIAYNLGILEACVPGFTAQILVLVCLAPVAFAGLGMLYDTRHFITACYAKYYTDHHKTQLSETGEHVASV